MSATKHKTTYKTAESVSPKHPDKLCDQISDAILDAYLEQDKNSRVAVEAVGGHGEVYVVGEVTSHGKVQVEPIVKRLAGDSLKIHVNIVAQSPEIAQGVDPGGAGDQGIMVGYACNETPELLPTEVMLARQLNQLIYKDQPYDGKTQVTLKDGKICAVVASFQHATQAELKAAIEGWLHAQAHTGKVAIHVNPCGDWEQGGFDADTGLTGRKLVIDNYGPRVPVGGGAFSGKDPSKVDRSAAYAARRVAVDYLRERKASEVYCYLAYAIGVAEPLEAVVIVDGIMHEVDAKYDLTPAAIIRGLGLRSAQYEETARWGHFGHDFTWEVEV